VVKPRGSLAQMFPAFYSYLEDDGAGTGPGQPVRRAAGDDTIVINWVTPNFDLVSGGMKIAFELMAYLEQHGFKNNLYIFGGTHFRDGDHARETILQNYCHTDAEVFLGIDGFRPADIIIAAGWQCAWPVKNRLAAPLKVFLVQDYEPYLYAMGSEHFLAEEPLRFGFYGLALGPWAKKVAARHGMRSTSFDFAIDTHVFYPRPEIARSKKRIVFYGRYVTPRRAFELGVVALDMVRRERPDVEIVFHGWGTPSSSVPFEFLDCGIMPDAERAELYAGATVGLALSLTNASMVPLEMMASRLPVVELMGDHTTTFYGKGHEQFISLAGPHPRGVADMILKLLDDEGLRERLADKGAKFVTRRTWAKAGADVERALRRELKRVRPD
jgi:glycosyltransferase involved in cell wall biosynthesis